MSNLSPRKTKGSNAAKGLNLNLPLDKKDTVRDSQDSGKRGIGRQSPDPPKDSSTRPPHHAPG